MTLAKLNRIFSELAWKGHWETEGAIAATDWAPSVDIKAISVNVDNNILTIKGERHLERDLKKESYHRVECSYGKFSRSFSLPSFVDPDHVRGEHKDGLLTLPKEATGKSRTVVLTAA